MVIVKKEGEFYPDDHEGLKSLILDLPKIVAIALTTDPNTDGELVSKEIKIYVSNFGPRDIHTNKIEITVFANDYPERRRNLDERRKALITMIYTCKHPSIITGDGSVWILLCPGSYGIF